MIFSVILFSATVILSICVLVNSRGILNTIFVSFPILLYSLLVAFKGESGSDTLHYIIAYENIENLWYFRDVFFNCVLWLLNAGDFSFDSLNYLNAMLIFCSLFLVAQKKGPGIVLFYIIFIGINIDFSTMRQSYAVHVFIIVLLLSSHRLMALISAIGFHFSVLFCYITDLFSKKISLKIIFIFVMIFSIASIYLIRYLEFGQQFIFRSGYSFILQSLCISMLLFLLRFEHRINFGIFLLSILPIGFRLIVFPLVILSPSKKPSHFTNRLVLAILFIAVSFFKIQSFHEQSLHDDVFNSIIYHYDNLWR